MTVAREQETIEAEIAELQGAAAADGRPLSEVEQRRLEQLIVERAHSYRYWDAKRREAYVRERRAVHRPREVATLRRAVRPSPVFFLLLGVSALSGVLLTTSLAERLAKPLTIVFILSSWIACVCVHEFGHALAGYLGGDDGVVERGALRLDPRHYTNRTLSIIIPVVFLLLGGIGLPGGSVYVDRRNLHSRRWGLLVSIGGPLGTLLCLLLVSVPFLVGAPAWLPSGIPYFWAALAALADLLAAVLILNLLPIPPLDGFRIVAYWLPARTRQQLFALGWKPVILLYMVLGVPNPFSDAFWSAGDRIALLLRVPLDLAEFGISLLRLF